MGPDLSALAFAPWVADFVAASNALSGIDRAATRGEVAAHRGFFARRRVAASNIVLLRAHLRGPGGEAAPGPSPGADGMERIDALLDGDRSPWQVYTALRDMAPFPAANGRCARALWMSRRMMEGYRPDPGRLAPDWTRVFRTDCPAPRGRLPARTGAS